MSDRAGRGTNAGEVGSPYRRLATRFAELTRRLSLQHHEECAEHGFTCWIAPGAAVNLFSESSDAGVLLAKNSVCKETLGQRARLRSEGYDQPGRPHDATVQGPSGWEHGGNKRAPDPSPARLPWTAP